LRTEVVSSKISDASDVTFNGTDKNLDLSSVHLSHMSLSKTGNRRILKAKQQLQKRKNNFKKIIGDFHS
jgi:hypothetical protein